MVFRSKKGKTKMLKKIAIVILFCGLIPMLWSYDNEPDGFRGIKWGTPLDNFAPAHRNLVSGEGKIDIYTIPNDELRINDSNDELWLQDIWYVFYDKKLARICLLTTGKANFDKMKRICFNKFGPGIQPKLDEEIYYWYGDTTLLNLIYGNTGRGFFRMTSAKSSSVSSSNKDGF